MIIGIDLDGVVFNTESYFRTYGELFDIKIGGKGMINPTELKVRKRYGWSEEARQQFLEEVVTEVEKTAPLMPYAKEVLAALKQAGHKLVVITSRGYLYNEEIEITKQRLQEEGLEFDKVIYKAYDKLDLCKEEKLDLLLEDFSDNVEVAANAGIKCLYFRDASLKEVKHENVTEVHNWAEVLRYVLNCQGNKSDLLKVVSLRDIGGNKYLRQISREVDLENEDISEMVEKMGAWCKENPCFAMAAVQFAYPKRLIYLKHSSENVLDKSQDERRVLVNPKIIEMEGETTYWEKCVSCDPLGFVHRPYKIKMEYYDLDKNRHVDEFEGFIATILCHEYDHLNGVLHIDRAEKLIGDMSVEERVEFRKKPENAYNILSKSGKFEYKQ